MKKFSSFFLIIVISLSSFSHAYSISPDDFVQSTVNRASEVLSKNIETLDNLEKNSVDFYASVKSVYLQDRENKIKNIQRGSIDVIYKEDEDWEEIDNR